MKTYKNYPGTFTPISKQTAEIWDLAKWILFKEVGVYPKRPNIHNQYDRKREAIRTLFADQEIETDDYEDIESFMKLLN